jgi:hypothetical protein
MPSRTIDLAQLLYLFGLLFLFQTKSVAAGTTVVGVLGLANLGYDGHPNDLPQLLSLSPCPSTTNCEVKSDTQSRYDLTSKESNPYQCNQELHPHEAFASSDTRDRHKG